MTSSLLQRMKALINVDERVEFPEHTMPKSQCQRSAWGLQPLSGDTANNHKQDGPQTRGMAAAGHFKIHQEGTPRFPS